MKKLLALGGILFCSHLNANVCDDILEKAELNIFKIEIDEVRAESTHYGHEIYKGTVFAKDLTIKLVDADTSAVEFCDRFPGPPFSEEGMDEVRYCAQFTFESVEVDEPGFPNKVCKLSPEAQFSELGDTAYWIENDEIKGYWGFGAPAKLVPTGSFETLSEWEAYHAIRND